MANHQVPQTLIDHIQISLRKEALLGSFNPNDPSIPPSPTLESAIAGIGQFRCPHCKGKLLRGLESIICVYCGRPNQEESPRKEISFKSTLGFRWLLQSLRLDGSESVGPSSTGTQSNRGQRSRKDEIVLSDFLNMELQWPEESNRFGIINEERSLTLVGVDLNELAPEGSSDNASTTYSEQIVTSKNTELEETTIFHGQRNLNLFGETKVSQPAPKSSEGDHDEAFSGWEAEFQSATPNAKGPFADNTFHLDSVKGDDTKKTANISSSHSHPSDLPTEDLDASFALPSLHKQPEENILAEGVPSGFSFPLEDQHEITTGHPSHTESKVGDESFDQWNDFRVTGLNNNHSEPSTTANLASLENSVPDISDGWQDFMGSVALDDHKAGEEDFGLLNVAQQDQQDLHADTLQSKTFSQDDSIGLWSPAVSTTVPEDQSLDLWNDFKSSPLETQVVNNMTDNKMTDNDDKTIDLWNDFTSLGASNNEDQISTEKDNYDKSFSSSKDNSINTWNDLIVPTSVSAGKSISDDITFGEWNDFSSSTVTHGDQNQSSSKKAAESQTVFETDDSFSLRNDLKTSGTVGNSYPSTIAIKSSEDQTTMDNASQGLESMKENSSFDIWGDFGQSLLRSDKQSEDKPTGDVNDFFSGWSETGQHTTNPHNDKVNSNGAMARDVKSINKNDDSFDAWGDFTASSNIAINQVPSSSAPVHVPEEAVKHDDVFDSWNVLTSPSKAHAGNNIIFPEENVQEISLFDTNGEGVECTNSSKHDLLLGVSSDQNYTPQDASSAKIPDLVRTENGEITSSLNSELKSSDAEILISEMHDLSFMLENSLTIPQIGQ